MNIWIIETGEPVPVGKEEGERLLRAGYLANLMADSGHNVLWWSSAFDHARKQHRFPEDRLVNIRPGLRIQFLNGGGYRSNVSLARIRDLRRMAKRFRQLALTFPKPDIVFCAFPSIRLSEAAVQYGQAHRIPVVLDMRDMWPDIFSDLLPRPFQAIGRLFFASSFNAARRACSHATAITGMTDAFVDWGLDRGERLRGPLDRSFPFGYAQKRPDNKALSSAEEMWDNLGVTTANAGRTICFIGNMGRQLDVGTIIRAARETGMTAEGLRFVLCGSGDRFGMIKKMANGANNVIFPGRISAAEIFALMRRCYAGLDPLPDRYDFLASINNKAIEYLSAGLPVISCPKKGVLFELLKAERCGLSYEFGDAEELGGILLDLSRDHRSKDGMAKNALDLFRREFVAENVYKQMGEYLEMIVRTAGGQKTEL